MPNPKFRDPSELPNETAETSVHDRRTMSGEQRIDLSTRYSEKFEIPDEALRSQPPAPPSSGIPPSASATARMHVPESLKMLALPTPFKEMEVQPSPLVNPIIPAATPLPVIELPPIQQQHTHTPVVIADETPASAKTLAKRKKRPKTAREIASAIALFVLLLGASAVAARLIAPLLFR